jgi:putative ATP-grasp target RiPP
MPALLTSGLPTSLDFIDWTSVDNERPPAPPHTDNQPFGYRFRTSPPAVREPIGPMEYDPDLQMVRSQIDRTLIPQAKGTRCGGNTYTATSLDGVVIIDVHRDVLYDD